jgi:hypothetical protein
MSILNLLQSMGALSGISMIAFGALWLKSYLKRSFCC